MIGDAVILVALVTPAWFAARIARHHLQQRANLRAWKRELDR